MSQANAILGLLTQTSLHAGTGQNTGTIDLPIQREGHNGWPCVFGSAVKGALRTAAEDRASGNVSVVYGPGPKESTSDYGGAIAVGDARLLLLPVRSLTSQFRWVTCPDALSRYGRDRERLGLEGIQGVLDVTDTNDQSDAVVHGDEDGDPQPLFLEEYRFQVRSQNLDKVIESLTSLMKRDGIADALKKQLVIVSNDSFAHLTQHATPVNAHIAIESGTKTVIGGALWYEETLPPETLLYVLLTANNGRAPIEEGGTSRLDAANVLGEVTGLFAEHHWFQLGGNETMGMGWCAVETVMAPVIQTGGQEG